MGMGETIVSVALALTLGAIPLAILYYLFKTKNKKLDTLVKIVELGGNVDPEMMSMLNEGGGGYKLDYKYGLIWLAVGIPVCLGMFLEGGLSESVFGLIPVFVGIAFIISAKYRLRENS